jgi:hypothetical protein
VKARPRAAAGRGRAPRGTRTPQVGAAACRHCVCLHRRHHVFRATGLLTAVRVLFVVVVVVVVAAAASALSFTVTMMVPAGQRGRRSAHDGTPYDRRSAYPHHAPLPA